MPVNEDDRITAGGAALLIEDVEYNNEHDGLILNVHILCSRVLVMIQLDQLRRAENLLHDAFKFADLAQDKEAKDQCMFWRGMTKAAEENVKGACVDLLNCNTIFDRLFEETRVWIKYIGLHWDVVEELIDNNAPDEYWKEEAKKDVRERLARLTPEEVEEVVLPFQWTGIDHADDTNSNSFPGERQERKRQRLYQKHSSLPESLIAANDELTTPARAMHPLATRGPSTSRQHSTKPEFRTDMFTRQADRAEGANLTKAFLTLNTFTSDEFVPPEYLGYQYCQQQPRQHSDPTSGRLTQHQSQSLDQSPLGEDKDNHWSMSWFKDPRHHSSSVPTGRYVSPSESPLLSPDIVDLIYREQALTGPRRRRRDRSVGSGDATMPVASQQMLDTMNTGRRQSADIEAISPRGSIDDSNGGISIVAGAPRLPADIPDAEEALENAMDVMSIQIDEQNRRRKSLGSSVVLNATSKPAYHRSSLSGALEPTTPTSPLRSMSRVDE